jgi:cytochrome c553
MAAGGAPTLAADLEAGRRKAEPCAACHGRDGNAPLSGTPSLAGQPVYFTHWQLIKYRDGRRKDPVMAPFAAILSDADMADLSAYYAAQRPRRRPRPPIRRGSRPGSRSPIATSAPRAIAPDSSGKSRPRAWPARTSTISCACCAASRPGPRPISTGP